MFVYHILYSFLQKYIFLFVIQKEIPIFALLTQVVDLFLTSTPTGQTAYCPIHEIGHFLCL